MHLKTTKFGVQEIDLRPHTKKKGANSIINSIIKEMKTLGGVSRLTGQEKAQLHVELRKQLL